MWKSLRIGEIVARQLRGASRCERSFLSEAYRCEEAWAKRLDSPVLQKVTADEMFLELDQKFQQVGKVSAVDVDIYANKIAGDAGREELIDIIHRMRLTPETSNTLDSTHHAVVRYFLGIDRTNDLLDILNDRLNYGIFPDYFCCNILMDTFVERKQYGDAAKIASLLMLQEESENPISNALSLYSCFKYLENPDEWKAPEPEKDESTEEVKVRVRFLRNPYFDDHFDLREPSEIVGKTLAFLGKFMDDPLGRTCRLRGLILHKKYAAATDLIKNWIAKGADNVVYKDVLPLIDADISRIPESETDEGVAALKAELSNLAKCNLAKEDLMEAMKSNVERAIDQQAQEDISQQRKMFVEWEEKRMSVLQSHLAELDRQARIKNIRNIKRDLEQRERILTFFEKEEEIELKIEQKLQEERRMRGKDDSKSTKTSQEEEDSYIPPEIRK